MKEVEGSEQGLQGLGEERNARPRVTLGEKTSPSRLPTVLCEGQKR